MKHGVRFRGILAPESDSVLYCNFILLPAGLFSGFRQIVFVTFS